MNGFELTAENKITWRQAIIGWGYRHIREFPWRWVNDPYKVLVAEILLAQTFARKVVPVYLEIVQKYPTLSCLAQAKEDELRNCIRPLGLLYRASTLINIAKALNKDYGQNVPSEKNSLLQIKGIGPYIASSVLCFAFAKREAIVDANVVRIVGRFLGFRWPPHSSCENKAYSTIAEVLLPEIDYRMYNYSLIDFGALVCKHYNPDCHTCPLTNCVSRRVHP